MANLIAAVLVLAGVVLATEGADVAGAPTPASAGSGSRTPKMPSLFAFGDSIVDTGKTITRVQLPSVRQGLPRPQGHRQILRRQDQHGLPSFCAWVEGVSPAVLDKNLTLEDLKTGVSFASAGSGYDNDTCWTADVGDDGGAAAGAVHGVQGQGGEQSIPDRALYLVCWGSSDVIQYFAFPDGKTNPDYIDFMTKRASTFVQVRCTCARKLIDLGVRQIAVTGVPPVGCAPAQQLIAGGLRRQCATDRNQMAQLYNGELSQEIAKMASRFRGVNLVYIDLYSILDDIVQRYQALGFKNGKDACCGFIGIETGILCNFMSPVWENPAQFVFWDGYHPSQTPYKIMIYQLIAKYIRFLR
ncbi:hypothetical protein ACP70R_020682 [Stipagrostis hirtigluma subsp. patula]